MSMEILQSHQRFDALSISSSESVPWSLIGHSNLLRPSALLSASVFSRRLTVWQSASFVQCSDVFLDTGSLLRKNSVRLHYMYHNGDMKRKLGGISFTKRTNRNFKISNSFQCTNLTSTSNWFLPLTQKKLLRDWFDTLKSIHRYEFLKRGVF